LAGSKVIRRTGIIHFASSLNALRHILLPLTTVLLLHCRMSFRERKTTCATIEAKEKKKRFSKDFPSGSLCGVLRRNLETRKERSAWYGPTRVLEILCVLRGDAIHAINVNAINAVRGVNSAIV